MAVWGAPFAGDNDAVEAVSAGLDLLKALNEYCQTTRIPGASQLKLRVGINSGPVFAGYVGMRNEYTVIGDTVNVAARLEQIAEPGTVVIGENTLRMVQGSFRVKALDPTHVKGKAEAVQPYRIEGRLVNPGRIRYQSADSLVTCMVGREQEMEKLQGLYARAFEGSRPLMGLLIGEVGMGKSRLLMEFSNALEQRGERRFTFSPRAGWRRHPKFPSTCGGCCSATASACAMKTLLRWPPNAGPGASKPCGRATSPFPAWKPRRCWGKWSAWPMRSTPARQSCSASFT